MDEHCFAPWDSADKESDYYEWEGVKYNIATGHVIDWRQSLQSILQRTYYI